MFGLEIGTAGVGVGVTLSVGVAVGAAVGVVAGNCTFTLLSPVRQAVALQAVTETSALASSWKVVLKSVFPVPDGTGTPFTDHFVLVKVPSTVAVQFTVAVLGEAT